MVEPESYIGECLPQNFQLIVSGILIAIKAQVCGTAVSRLRLDDAFGDYSGLKGNGSED